MYLSKTIILKTLLFFRVIKDIDFLYFNSYNDFYYSIIIVLDKICTQIIVF